MDVLNKVPVREQEPAVRAANFEEVCLGYNEEEAMTEAARCLNCKNAQCVKGCLRTRLPAGDTVRGQMHPRHQGRSGLDRKVRAVYRGLGERARD